MSKAALKTKNAEETRDLAAGLAEALRPGDVLALSGPLGAGKTVFVQGLARGLGMSGVLATSPTFVILHEYPGRVPLYHFDFYRLERIEEVFGLGYEEFFEGPGVTAVEWADKFPDLFGDSALWVRMEPISESERRIEVEAGPGLSGRWTGIREAFVR